MLSQKKELFCSKCCYQRPISDFQINKQGKRQKTCYKHSKKRAFPESEAHQWDDLIYEISTWSKPGQTKRLALNLDPMPISLDFITESSSIADGQELDNNIEILQCLSSNTAIKTSIAEILQQQESIGNTRFLEVYFQEQTDITRDKILLDEISRLKRQRTVLKTWSRYLHPAAAYYT